MNSTDAMWRKSSRSSGGGNGDCVEVATDGETVLVRDSKRPDGPTLSFTAVQWRAFIGVVCRPNDFHM